MRFATARGSPIVLPVLLVLLALPTGGLTLAENIDPDNDGSQYAYGENVGWINAEPSGDGGPGVQILDFELRGYLWGENVGWVSLSCFNDSTCGTTDYRVLNDGSGTLSGYAWGENVGWINFAPATAGVQIDAETGAFSGRAWGENVGWITFASSGLNPFQVKTDWACQAAAAPAGSPELVAAKSGTDAVLEWEALPEATAADVVQGDLSTLRASAGDFSSATTGCLADNRQETTWTVADTPAPGEGAWFLVRPVNCSGPGSHDTGGGGQMGTRDGEIDASTNECP